MKKIIAVLLIPTIITVMTPLAAACSTFGTKMTNEEGYVYVDKTRYDYNEYDYIVGIREASQQGIIPMNLSNEEFEVITSDAIETELLHRASLPVEVLQSGYGYSDEAIRILKEYDGKPVENSPELRTVMASFYGALGETVCTSTRIGVIYTWEWSNKPLWLHKDGVTLSWEGTYEDGLSNNMRFDIHSSYARINYICDSVEGAEQEKTVTLDSTEYFSSDAYTNGVALQFAASEVFSPLKYWAKSGSVFVYADLVNQESGPALYELDVRGEYVHATTDDNWSASFPWGLSVSLSGEVETFGEKHLTLSP